MKLQNPQLKGGHYAPIHGISPDMIVTPPAVLARVGPQICVARAPQERRRRLPESRRLPTPVR